MKNKQLNILIAPLDWGLGHVTRCLPIITYIQEAGHQVVFAGNTSQQSYILARFPNIKMVELEGYNVKYSTHSSTLLPKIISQLPRLRKLIKKEHYWLQEIINEHHIDAVISDNRYGLYSTKVPCIFMTHQLKVRTGMGAWADRLLQKIHYRFIEKFGTCWVVDVPQAPGLSGELGHSAYTPNIKTEYIGLLSQCNKDNSQARPAEEEYLLILLSGAEPQRSILADMLWKKAVKANKQIIFVAGNENAPVPKVIPGHISFHQRLSSEDLQTAINAASIVICRSGYSSLMDLTALHKKAIIIPTPRQSEQEYLARQMHAMGYFMKGNQSKFDIHTALLNAALFPFKNDIDKEAFSLHRYKLKLWLDTVKQLKAKKV